MATEPNQVIIFSTGGTFEKSYCEKEGALANRESQLKERLLKKLRMPHTDLQVREIMAKDSLKLTDEDRQIIWMHIEKSVQVDQLPIVVLHGTDTMAETVKFGFQHGPTPDVPVVFTGAMRPLGFEDSDGPQNFVEALMAANYVQPGIYISFHGYLFNAPNVRKCPDRGTFEALD